MRINFNPVIKNNFFSLVKRQEAKNTHIAKNSSFGALEALAMQNIAFCAKNKSEAIYAFSRDNRILKFESKTAASDILDCNFTSITKCLNGQFHESNGYAFVSADEIEIKKEDGTIELDEKVIKRVREGFNNAKTTPVYAISLDGTAQKFDSLAAASEALEISVSTISKSLLKSGHTAAKYVFISANDLELKDETGAVIYDENGRPELNYEVKKAELERFSKAYRGPVCKIDYSGNIRRFYDENEAFNNSGHKVATIRDINERGKVHSKHVYVQESAIILRDEKGFAMCDKNGNYIYDIAKINKVLEAFEDVKIRPVKATNLETGEVLDFECASVAADKLKITKQAIHANLKGKHKTASGYKFEYLYPRTIKSYNLITE